MTQTATAPPTIHVVQIRDHMAGKRHGNGTCGAEGRTTWPEMGHMPAMWFSQKTMAPEAPHGRAGKVPLPQQKTRVKNPGYGVWNIIP